MIKMENISKLATEKRNENSFKIDNMSTIEILTVMNEEDMTVAQKVRDILPQISETVDLVQAAFKQGGRLFYVGAGTSGRLGILDAVECPPTFSTPPELVQGLIAGGMKAIEKAVEGAEDSEVIGETDLKERALTDKDVVVGIAASGRTPYVIGALKYANEIGAGTVSLSSNKDSIVGQYADIALEVESGAEVITGSTRLKAATAHKMILNMITSASMIKVGKVYENLMVDVSASNLKLRERAKGIVQTISGASYKEAEVNLEKSNYEVKTAIVMIESGVSYDEAKVYIEQAEGFVRKAIELAVEGKK